jgi:ribosomal-protein-alanine N-acetyltransferase
MRVPTLETERLLIREFVIEDLQALPRVLDVEVSQADSRAEMQRWLEWTILGYEQLPKLHQPPYGDRGIALKSTGELIGACGFAPNLDPFDQLPALRAAGEQAPRGGNSPEVGLYWAISPAHQRQGYATEAGRALITYAFDELHLRRIVATTEYSNAASIAVIRKLGMRPDRNPSSEPPWLQVVGVLERHG